MCSWTTTATVAHFLEDMESRNLSGAPNVLLSDNNLLASELKLENLKITFSSLFLSMTGMQQPTIRVL